MSPYHLHGQICVYQVQYTDARQDTHVKSSQCTCSTYAHGILGFTHFNSYSFTIYNYNKYRPTIITAHTKLKELIVNLIYHMRQNDVLMMTTIL